MAHVIVIPARFSSTRFPGKLLRDDSGWPLIRHVVERCKSVRGVDRVVVAADGARIADAVRAFGGEVVITDPELPTGTDRVAAAVRALGVNADRDLIVNVQGDEPDIDPAHIELLFKLLGDEEACGLEARTPSRTPRKAQVATLAARRAGAEGLDDPNRVKVVLDLDGFALYFSRAPIPYPRSGFPKDGSWLYHVGVYGFMPGALTAFAAHGPTQLEQVERLEQLRFLEMGFGIRVGVVDRAAEGIDTPEDYARFLATSKKSSSK